MPRSPAPQKFASSPRKRAAGLVSGTIGAANVDQTNPRHCVSCRGREECIFRRTVIRDAPADFFTWPELVGVEHIPGGHLTGAIGQGAHLSQGQGSSQGMRMEGVVQNQGPGGRREGDS